MYAIVLLIVVATLSLAITRIASVMLAASQARRERGEQHESAQN